MRREYEEPADRMLDRQYHDAEKLRVAQDIFGDDDEDLELPQVGQTDKIAAPDEVPLDSIFDADEIDDPFSTTQDKQIESLDICERL